MSRAGEVVGTAQNLAIVRSGDDSHPAMGASLDDDQLDAVGRVVDVFGPVERPYVAVTPDDGVRLPTLVGSPLYERDGE
jgi:RNA-binding protein